MIIDNSKVGILGYGEVGQSLAKFYQNPKIKDLDRDDGLLGIEVLNVCIPFIPDFLEAVEKEIRQIEPTLTIIHSSVAPKTIKRLVSVLPKKLKMIVHSPVRGVHPYLCEGLKTFVKYIGAENDEAAELARNHLESLGIKTKVFIPAVTTEIGKLFSTSYYGLCIAWHGEMKKICDDYEVDFEKAVTDFNQTYNQGYSKLGKLNVLRPVLYPPEKSISGHCVGNNAKILRKAHNSTLLDGLLEYDKPEEDKNKE